MSFERRRQLRPRSRPSPESLETRELLSVAGTVDPSHGAQGYNTIPVITPRSAISVVAHETAVAVGPGGQVDLVGGLSEGDSPSLTTQTDLTVTQLMPDGSVDPSFGYNGQSTVLSRGFVADAAFVLPSGKILLAGTAHQLVLAGQPGDFYGTVRFNADGSVDTTYGTDGFALNPELKPDGTPLTNGLIARVAIQADGKIVLAGTADLTDPQYSEKAGPFVVRVNADGTPDTTFGQGGEVFVPPVRLNNFGVFSNSISGLAVQPSGQIVILGSAVDHSVSVGEATGLLEGGYAIRLGANGALDTAFGGASAQANGVVYLPNDPGGALVEQPNGQLLVAGTNLTHLNADGTPDTTFGPGGVSPYLLQVTVTRAVAQPSGKIDLIGNFIRPDSSGYPSPVAVFQLNADLTPDPTFGNTSTPGLAVETTSPLGFSVPESVAIQPDGNLLLAGTRTSQPDPILSFFTVRILTQGTPGPGDPTEAAGTLDTTYGSGGLGSTPVAGSLLYSSKATPQSAGVVAAAIEPDGKFIVVGSVQGSPASGQPAANASYGVVVRYYANGAIDTTFGGNGVNAFPNYGSASAVATSSNGLIFVAFTSPTVAGGTINPPGVYAILANPTFQSGSYDRSFGTNGLASFSAPSEASFVPVSMTVQTDGKVVVAGTAIDASGNFDFAFARLNTDGTPDTTFGVAGGSAPGFELVPFAINKTTLDHSPQIALQPDGKIVVVGSAANGTTGGAGSPNPALPNFDAVASRLNADGSLDTTFGGSTAAGKVILFPSPNPQAPSHQGQAVALQPGGSILVLEDGDMVVRLKSDGTLDTGFGFGGTIFTDPSTTLLVQADGKIVTAGNRGLATPTNLGGVPGVSRFTVNGSIDPTFGDAATPGVSTLALSPLGVVAAAVEFDGNILLAGNVPDPTATNPNVNSFAASRVLGQVEHFTPPPVSPPPVSPPPVSPPPVSPPPVSPPPVSPPPVSPPPVSPPPVSPPPVSPPPVSPPPVSPPPVLKQPPADFDGSGRSNLAVYLPSIGAFATRPTSGKADIVTPFGIPGVGQTLPAPGDYDGSGRTEYAAYLPANALYAYRPAGGGPDVLVPFGVPGAGQTIPAPGDYQGVGKDNIAVYLPSFGAFAYRPFGGGADQIIPFGIAGAGQSIPAPADYFGTGRSDIAVYLPSIGAFAIRPPGGGPDQIIPFGIAGAGRSIPIPGDYDGSGHAELAVYFPSLGLFAYRPAKGGPDVIQAFGAANDGTVPVPGDYTGVGHLELAIFDPNYAYFAIRPGGGGADRILSFGIAGVGQTLAVAAPESTFLPTVPPTPIPRALAATTTQGTKVSAAGVTPKGPSALAAHPSSKGRVAQADPARKHG